MWEYSGRLEEVWNSQHRFRWTAPELLTQVPMDVCCGSRSSRDPNRQSHKEAQASMKHVRCNICISISAANTACCGIVANAAAAAAVAPAAAAAAAPAAACCGPAAAAGDNKTIEDTALIASVLSPGLGRKIINRRINLRGPSGRFPAARAGPWKHAGTI